MKTVSLSLLVVLVLGTMHARAVFAADASRNDRERALMTRAALCLPRISRKLGLPPQLLWAIKLQESGNRFFNVVRVNPSGSRDLGIMQVNDRYWLKTLKQKVDPRITAEMLIADPCVNLYAGGWILRHYILRHGLDKGVSSYHSRDPSRGERYRRKIYRHLLNIARSRLQ